MGKINPYIQFDNVVKIYPMGKRDYHALRGVSLAINAGDFVALVGPSGSGKSTILNLLTGLDRPTSGTVSIGGLDITNLSENKLARWRGENIGIVFQFFQLMPTLTALENILLPMQLRPPGLRLAGNPRRLALNALEMVNLANHASHLPRELSGGEQQRVAIARAIINDPPLLVADEPTGNLDTDTGEAIFDIFRELSARGKTIVYVTHDPQLAAQAHRTVQVRNGNIISNISAIVAPGGL